MQDVADPDNDASQCPLQQNKDFNLPPALTALATASQCPLQQNKDFNGLSSSS